MLLCLWLGSVQVKGLQAAYEQATQDSKGGAGGSGEGNNEASALKKQVRI